MLIIIVITIGSYILLVRLLSRKLILNKESIILIILFLWIFIISKIYFPQYYSNEFFPPIFRLIFISFFLFIIFSNHLDRSFNIIINKGFLWALIVFILLSSIDAVNHLFSGVRLGTNQMDNSNDYAYTVLLFIFPLTYFFLTDKDRWKKNVYFILIAICIVLIILSGSKKAFFTLILFFAILYLLRNLKKVFVKPSRIITAAISITIFIILINIVIDRTYLGERITKTFELEQTDLYFDERFAGRGKFYLQGIHLFFAHPIIGIGLGNFKTYEQTGMVSHSDYISMLVESGLVSFILYFYVYISIIIKLIKTNFVSTKNKSDQLVQRNIFLAGIICVLFIALGRWNYNHPGTFILLAAANQFANTNQINKLKND